MTGLSGSWAHIMLYHIDDGHAPASVRYTVALAQGSSETITVTTSIVSRCMLA